MTVPASPESKIDRSASAHEDPRVPARVAGLDDARDRPAEEVRVRQGEREARVQRLLGPLVVLEAEAVEEAPRLRLLDRDEDRARSRFPASGERPETSTREKTPRRSRFCCVRMRRAIENGVPSRYASSRCEDREARGARAAKDRLAEDRALPLGDLVGDVDDGRATRWRGRAASSAPRRGRPG